MPAITEVLIIVCVGVIAFAEWPVLRKLKQLEARN